MRACGGTVPRPDCGGGSTWASVCQHSGLHPERRPGERATSPFRSGDAGKAWSPLPGTFLAFLGRLLHGPGRAGRSGASHSPSRARPTAWNLGGGASLGPAPGAPRGAPPAAGGALPPAPPWTLESGVGVRQSGWGKASLRGPAQRPAPGGSHPLLQTLRRGVLEEASAGTAARDGTSRRRYSHGSDCAGSARCVSF